MRKMFAVIALLALSGCGELEIAKPPADKLVCPDEPEAPAGEVTDKQAGAYMVALRASWQGCRADVDWLRVWFDNVDK